MQGYPENKIRTADIEQAKRDQDIADDARGEKAVRMSRDSEFLECIAARLVTVYGESPNVDFVMKLREIAGRIGEEKVESTEDGATEAEETISAWRCYVLSVILIGCCMWCLMNGHSDFAVAFFLGSFWVLR